METRYLGSLASACNWLLASERRSGGSAAHWMPVSGWSRAYPETTGYIIPTLIDAGELLGDRRGLRENSGAFDRPTPERAPDAAAHRQCFVMAPALRALLDAQLGSGK